MPSAGYGVLSGQGTSLCTVTIYSAARDAPEALTTPDREF